MRCAGIPAYGVQRANFHKKMKIMNLQYFDSLMYIWWLLKFVEVFFCRSARTFQLVSQQSWHQKPQNFNKTAACSHHYPLRHPAPSLGHWYTGVYLRIFDPGPNNPTTFLALCSPGDYKQSLESAMGCPTFSCKEKALTFTIYDCILRIRPKKVCYVAKVSPLDVELI